MTIQYEVLDTAPSKERRRAGIQGLFERVFARPLDEGDWRHAIVDTPYEPGRCVVAVDGDRVVGTANLIPQRLAWDGDLLHYFLFTTSMVDPDYRRQGVYMQTTRLAIDESRRAGKSFILAFPNDVALRPLTTLFRFKRIQDLPIVSGRLDDLGLPRPLRQERSVCLDRSFADWRLAHRTYFSVSHRGLVLVCKRYLDAIDVVEVLENPPPTLQGLLPEEHVPLDDVNVLASRCPGAPAGRPLTTLHMTCYTIQDGFDPSQIDVSLLMWDVI